MIMKCPTRHLWLLLASLAMLFAGGSPFRIKAAAVDPALTKPQPPRLFPDYAGIVIPPNIAPLNFRVEEPGVRYRIEMRSAQGKPIVVTSRSATLAIPLQPWRALLRENAGQPLYCEFSVQDRQAGWRRFETVTNHIAREEIDSTLAYRLLKPLYNLYVNLGIYQRSLESFEEQPILQNQKFGGDCLNCHTFLNHRADNFALHIRTSKDLKPMLLVRSNEVTRVDKPMGYLSWHPSGRLLAFSANKLSMFFHTVGETRDVFDARSDLGIYRVDSNTLVTPPPIALPDRNETWPAWSPDGRHLYYSSAPILRLERFRQVRYDLMRVSYDLESDRWGEPEVLVSAHDSSQSAVQPKVSPDGRFVLFCLCKYGNFPVYQPSSDLYLMDLSTRQYRRLEVNSDQAESWHCWSRNSRWIVFSSKRLDGLFARPFFSYVDEQGRCHKPFLLPQEDPAFYDTFLKTFNVPELFQGPVQVKEDELARAVTMPRRVLVPKVGPHDAAEGPHTGEGADEGQSTYHQIPR